MAIQHSNMGTVLGWKHNHQSGMSTKDGVIIEFPGGIPTDIEVQQWIDEYEALTDLEKNPRLKRKDRLSKITTVLGLRQFIEEELL